MTCLYSRLAGLVLVVTACVLVVIRAQSYDDLNLRQLILPDGCVSPCFMGIRPGKTTVAEAVNLLQATGWVSALEVTKAESVTDGEVYIRVRWNWNTKQPAIIDSRVPAYMFSYEQDIRSAIDEIHIATAVSSGRLQLLLQPVTTYDIRAKPPDAAGKEALGVTLIYGQLESRAQPECPVKLYGLWPIRADLSFYSGLSADNGRVKHWDTYRIIRMLQMLCA